MLCSASLVRFLPLVRCSESDVSAGVCSLFPSWSERCFSAYLQPVPIQKLRVVFGYSRVQNVDQPGEAVAGVRARHRLKDERDIGNGAPEWAAAVAVVVQRHDTLAADQANGGANAD